MILILIELELKVSNMKFELTQYEYDLITQIINSSFKCDFTFCHLMFSLKFLNH